MARTIIRMWTKDGYHKDVAIMDERQVWMSYQGMEPRIIHLIAPIPATRLVVRPADFPEAVEFEVIVEGK